jgi:hypothetical protein
MFHWHENTRILLCRTAFLLLCIAPTLLVLAVAWRYRSPAYIEAQREEWERVLSDKLGYDVSIARVQYPAWDSALLEEVTLQDAETRAVLATARNIEIKSLDGNWHVAASYPRISAESLDTLVGLLHDRLLRTPSVKTGNLEFAASVIAFFNGEREQTFSDVTASIAPAPHGKLAKVQFAIDGVKAERRWELLVERHSTDKPPHTIATFPATQSAMPLDTLQVLFPWLSSLGKSASYQGELRTILYGKDSLIEFSGQLKQVDLEQLVAERLPHHKLTGQADIQLQALQLHNGSIALAKGSVRTLQGGEISQSLLDALSHKLQLAPEQPPKIASFSRVRFSHLAFGFQLDSQGLAITGDADPAAAGVVMASAAAGALLSESERTVLPVTWLVDALSPPSAHKIPATPEAKSWIDLLPPPAILSDDMIETARPNTNLRLRK